MNMIHLANYFNNKHIKNPFSFEFVKSFVFWNFIGISHSIDLENKNEQFGLYCMGGEL